MKSCGLSDFIMAASQNHFATAFKNNCIVRPRHPETGLPLTANDLTKNHGCEETFILSETKMQAGMLNEDLERQRTDWQTGNDSEEQPEILDSASVSNSSRSFDHDLSDLLQDDQKFYKHLKSLRRENKKTMKMLEKFYHSKPRTEEHIDPKRQDFVERMRSEVKADENDLFVHKVFDSITNDNQHESDEDDSGQGDTSNKESMHAYFRGQRMDLSFSDSEEDPRKEWPRNYSRNILPDDLEEKFRGREFSYEVIDNMWDNFSVDSYAPVEKGPKENTPVKKEWVPSITIPEPFQMSLREAAKSNIKSKRKEKLEQELMQKKLAEEAELNKKFRAKPLPPSTYMRLYKEHQAEEERKREYRRSLNKAILEATQKPFSFVKREEAKNELRRSQSHENVVETEEKKVEFKAKPYPNKLFDLTLEDKMAEQEEYRKIKMKMRSQEMLAISSLPPNMRARGERYSINNRYEKAKGKVARPTKSKTFQPSINHEIPDYEEIQKKFEIELVRKRREKSPTICEPFSFQTAKVPARRSIRINSFIEEENSLKNQKNRENSLRRSNSDLRRSFNGSISDEAPPFAMTETARLRHSMKQNTLEQQAKEEENERKKTERRKRRENQLRKQVARKSVANDMKHVMEKQNKETLQRYRESEIERKKAYKQYLKEIQAKLEQRPLLFEQESQTNAKRAAQRKYRLILKEAGVDDEVVDSLVTSDGKIINAESDDNTDDLLTDEDEADDTSAYGRNQDSKIEENMENSRNTADLNDTYDISDNEAVSDVE